jgi:cob(I)alamin adenosyltransferase
MKIYTRTGDDGYTGLFGGARVAKTHPRIAAYGTVDETNAAIGLARTMLDDRDAFRLADERLEDLQNLLFVLGGDLASPGEQKYPVPRIEEKHVLGLESMIDEMEADLAPLQNFILPGGAPAGAALHVARTVCRRAERLTCELAASEPVSEAAVHFLNRLSDLLFVFARWVNHTAGEPEKAWRPIERAGRTPASGA